jgi:hypothetical protein
MKFKLYIINKSLKRYNFGIISITSICTTDVKNIKLIQVFCMEEFFGADYITTNLVLIGCLKIHFDCLKL